MKTATSFTEIAYVRLVAQGGKSDKTNHSVPTREARRSQDWNEEEDSDVEPEGKPVAEMMGLTVDCFPSVSVGTLKPSKITDSLQRCCPPEAEK